MPINAIVGAAPQGKAVVFQRWNWKSCKSIFLTLAWRSFLNQWTVAIKVWSREAEFIPQAKFRVVDDRNIELHYGSIHVFLLRYFVIHFWAVQVRCPPFFHHHIKWIQSFISDVYIAATYFIRIILLALKALWIMKSYSLTKVLQRKHLFYISNSINWQLIQQQLKLFLNIPSFLLHWYFSCSQERSSPSFDSLKKKEREREILKARRKKMWLLLCHCHIIMTDAENQPLPVAFKVLALKKKFDFGYEAEEQLRS